MKYLDGNYQVEVKDHRYKIHPNENIILRERDPPTSLGTQNIKYRMRLRLGKIKKWLKTMENWKLKIFLKKTTTNFSTTEI